MYCRICGKEGHNSRTCPEKTQSKGSVPKADHALWVKVDNLTQSDADNLLKEFIDAKGRIAPHARGAFAKADKKRLPSEIRRVLQLPEPNTGAGNE